MEFLIFDLVSQIINLVYFENIISYTLQTQTKLDFPLNCFEEHGLTSGSPKLSSIIVKNMKNNICFIISQIS